MDDFLKPKIVYREISESMDAVLIKKEIYINNKCFMLTGEYLAFLVCYFNSSLFTKIILPSFNIGGGKGMDFLGKISVPMPTPKQDAEFAKLADAIQGELTEEASSRIDDAIFNFFGLSVHDRKIIGYAAVN